MTRRPAEPIGVLGGTFDPVHVGHLALAEHVRRMLALARALLLPAADPPHKPVAELSSLDHRLAMLRLAIDDSPGLSICTLESASGKVCYTVDTLRLLRHGDPPLDPVFIVGMDSLRQLPTWSRWRELIAEFDLAVIDREAGPAPPPLDPALLPRLVPLDARLAPERRRVRLRPGRGGRIFQLPIPPIPVSSSSVRATVAAGGDPTGLVPPAVARYIQRTGLYRQEDDR